MGGGNAILCVSEKKIEDEKRWNSCSTAVLIIGGVPLRSRVVRGALIAFR